MFSTTSEWVNAQLSTVHRETYIVDRESRRCHDDDCYRAGVSLTLFGTSTKWCQLHIEEALMAISTGHRPPLGRVEMSRVEGLPHIQADGSAKLLDMNVHGS